MKERKKERAKEKEREREGKKEILFFQELSPLDFYFP